MRRIGRQASVLLTIVAMCFVAYTIAASDGAEQCQTMEMELQSLRVANNNQGWVNAGLRKQIEAFRSDGRLIEKIAREELGMIRSDETIFLFPPEFSQEYASLR